MYDYTYLLTRMCVSAYSVTQKWTIYFSNNSLGLIWDDYLYDFNKANPYQSHNLICSMKVMHMILDYCNQ